MNNFEICILHDTPVSMGVVMQTIEVISRAALDVNMEFVNELRSDGFDISDEQVHKIESMIRENIYDTLWLETVEQGSSKLKGKVIFIAGGIVTTILANPVKDIVKETRIYKEFVSDTAGRVDRFVERIAPKISDEIAKLPTIHPRIFVERTNNGVQFFVEPADAQKDMSRVD